jgi:hypothetical protein
MDLSELTDHDLLTTADNLQWRMRVQHPANNVEPYRELLGLMGEMRRRKLTSNLVYGRCDLVRVSHHSVTARRVA